MIAERKVADKAEYLALIKQVAQYGMSINDKDTDWIMPSAIKRIWIV